MKKVTQQDFIDRACKIHNNKYTYQQVIYTGMHNKVKITCKNHGIFEQTPRNHIWGKNKQGQGCPTCYHQNFVPKNKLNNKVVDDLIFKLNVPIKRTEKNYINFHNIEVQCLKCSYIWTTSLYRIKNNGCLKCNDSKFNNKYIDNLLIQRSILIELIDPYINALTKVRWKCLKCNNIWLAQPCEIIRTGPNREGSGCPECARGKNEKRVGEVLKKLNIKIEKLVINLDSQKLYPDYFCPELNLIIEYNGIQHYQPTYFGKNDIDNNINNININFERQKDRDQKLRNYCLNNNINLFEIDGREYKWLKLSIFVEEYLRKNYVK